VSPLSASQSQLEAFEFQVPGASALSLRDWPRQFDEGLSEMR
jgi:hypothetical protein